MRYAKTIVAAVAALAVALQAVLTDNTITPEEWGLIATAVAGVFGVWRIPNR